MKTKLLLGLLLSVLSINASAQSFTAKYTFDSVKTTSGLIDPTPVPTATGVTFGSFSSSGVSANPIAIARFVFTGWPTGATNGNDTYSSLTGTPDLSKYYEVTVTPSSGYALTLSSLTFRAQRSGTGVRTFAVRSNLDGYSSNLPSSINPANTNLSVQTGDIFFWNFDAVTTGQNGSFITLPSGNFSNLSSPVKFRFYAWNAEATGGTFSIDSVAFTGVANISSGCTADITSGLVAKYDFTGNANDLSGNNLHGTVSGATLATDRFGNTNSAYSFDGNTNQIVLPSSELANATALSVSGWFNANSSQSGFSDIFQIDVNNPNTSNPANDMFLRYNNGLSSFSADLGIQGSVASINTTSPLAGTWHHFALTYNSSVMELFIDGVLINQGSVSGTFQSYSEPLYVGNWNAIEGFNGKIDDIRIYNRALTLCDVDSLYNYPNCAGITSTITTSGSTTFCQGDSVTLTATSASSYLWSNGAITQSITVKTPGSDSVTITNSNGCSATSTPTIVTVHIE